MQTISKQSKSLLVDIDKYIPDTSNPLAKAFKHKGSVFGFTESLKVLYPYIKEMASRTAGVRSITLKELTYILDKYTMNY